MVLVEESEAALLWQGIQTMVGWASRQNGASYTNWSQMEEALETVCDVSEQSDLEVLRETYGALRQAYMSL